MAGKAKHKPQVSNLKAAKIQALADRGATAGERDAAVAALERMPVPAKPASLTDGEREPLADPFIRQLAIPKTGSDIYWDALAGFGLRVNAGGGRVFFYNYRTKTGRQRRYTIGEYPSWSAGSARKEARRLDRIVDAGGDPLGDIQDKREAETVAELIERFKAEHLLKKRDSTQNDYKSMLRVYIEPALGKRKVAEIAPADIDQLHHRITMAGYPYRANRVINVVSKMFTLAVRWGLRTDNPAKGVEKNIEYQRHRYLKDGELPALLKALAAYPDQRIADVFRLLLLTGARRGEVLAMRWADIDLDKDIWSKPPSSTKQKQYHEIPLNEAAKKLLTQIRQQQTVGRRQLPEFVFLGSGATGHVVEVKKAWARFRKNTGIVDLRIHDLRHSFASELVSAGKSLPLIGALLGHANPSTTARYAHLMMDPQRQGAEHVGAIFTAAANGRPAPRSKAPRRRRS